MNDRDMGFLFFLLGACIYALGVSAIVRAIERLQETVAAWRMRS